MAVFTRNFVLLWQGQLVSDLGKPGVSDCHDVVRAGGHRLAPMVAGAMMAATLPLVLLAPIGGTLADRHSHRSILVCADLLRAIATGGVALVVLWEPDSTPRAILIIAIAAFNGVMSALFAPAFQALVPDLIPNDGLATANSINQMSTQAPKPAS